MVNTDFQPPRWADKFLRWFCSERVLETLQGDLYELYGKRLSARGKFIADICFIRDVLDACRPFAFRRRSIFHLNGHVMYKSHFKLGWRNLIRNQGYSFINIGGLALGMTVAMLIGLWIYDELSFNKYHSNYDDIAQVWEGSTNPETGIIEGAEALQFPLGAALRANYKHHFKHVVMAWWVGNYSLSDGDTKLTKMGEFIEAGAPDMLSLKMLKGSYAALKDPHSIILSASTAKALFGTEDAMDKSIKIDNRLEVIVTGVYEDLPANNRFAEVQFFAPWALWVSSNGWIIQSENNWGNRSFNIYVQVEPHTTIEAANEVVKNFFYENGPKELASEVEKYKPFLLLFPMNKWHLYSEFINGKPASGRITFVWLFGIVGIFVLLLACINFVNLSTARSEKRAKEVGVRKSVGSGKGQLIVQFLSESFLIVFLAFVVSLILSQLSLGWFNELADKDIELPLGSLVFWVINLGFILLTGFMAGLYPAFYLSSFQPVKVLKGTFRLGSFATLPRKVLVVVQFTVSVILIIGTIVVYQQIQHARNRPIGYTKEGLITVPLNDPNYFGKHEVLRTELINTGVVSEMALSSSPLTDVWSNSGGYIWNGGNFAEGKDNDFGICVVSHSFGKTVGWQFTDGRDFSPDLASDSMGVILNESAVKYMGLKNPVGELIRHQTSDKPYKILGVIRDMVMQSPYEPVKQTLFFLDNSFSQDRMNIRLKPMTSATEALPKIETAFKKVVPSSLFDYKFVDEEFARKFSQEQRIGELSGVFAILAIFISGLGLFGLASFVAEQRTKEIGIRKVVGASVFHLWRLLSVDFLILVMISCLLAIPVAYYYMQHWLQKYQYRADISWGVFAIAISSALLVTLMTVSYQAIKAAVASPVMSLRTE